MITFKFFLPALFLLWLIGSNNKIHSQTSVHIAYAQDSLINACPLPAQALFQVHGVVQGYSIPDSITATIMFGDGKDTVFKIAFNPAPPPAGFLSSDTIKHSYNATGIFIPTYILTGPDGKSDTLAGYRPQVVSNVCDSIKGKIYHDFNTDCIYNGTDGPASTVVQLLFQSNPIKSIYPDPNGEYKFIVPTGYSFAVSVWPMYYGGGTIYPICPPLGYYTVSSFPAQNKDFPMGCTPTFDFIPSAYMNKVRPGMPGSIYAILENAGCIPANGLLKLVFDDTRMSFVSVNQTPSNYYVIGDTVFLPFNLVNNQNTWNPQAYAHIQTFNDPTLTINDTVCFLAIAEPKTGDFNPMNNVKRICQPVSNSYDPNIKTVTPLGVGAQGLIPPGASLNYTIHFQNTGNDTAYNIFILDTLDPDLLINSLNLLASSHQVSVDILPGRVVRFNFTKIMLVDSLTNEPLSHGWVTYEIKADPGLSNGTTIQNSAGIYFDLNPPIITNTTLNTIDVSLSSTHQANHIEFAPLRVYPNPAFDHFMINMPQGWGALEIIDINGRVVYKHQRVESGDKIPTNDLPAGLYGIRVLSNGSYQSERLLITK